MAVTYRIKMLGLALLHAGAQFSVFHIGGSPFENATPEGIWRGIAYRYFPQTVRREPRRYIRLWRNACGMISAVAEIRRLRRCGCRVVVYSDLYAFENILLAATGAPVVAGISEWYPGRTDRTWWLRFIAAAGAVPISRAIEERIRVRMPFWRRSFPQLRVPILMDIHADSASVAGPAFASPYLLWTGDPFGEIRAHLEFLIDVLARVRCKHPDCKLVLMGNFNASVKSELEAQAERVAGSRSAITVHGFVPKEQLAAPIAGAAALLAPLPQGVRWECCFPTKIGEYLASGRPVVSSQIGEVAGYLSDGDTAMLALPDDADGWSDRIIKLLDDPALARRIGEAGRALAMKEFDYHVHSRRLFDFINDLCNASTSVRRK
jgi:glycosyltransferase involved in cell wall biosynthesis